MEVVQVVFLYESDMWVMSPHVGRTLGGFRHRVAHRLTGWKPRRGGVYMGVGCIASGGGNGIVDITEGGDLRLPLGL